MDDIVKSPRLFVDADLGVGMDVTLPDAAAHYLKNVLRRQPGDQIRVFNGRDGEFAATLSTASKRDAGIHVEKLLRPQMVPSRTVHLICPPLKKDALDTLIQKSVELGAHVIHPVITDHADVRDINVARVSAQIIEAAEQCERLDIPVLMPIKKLVDLVQKWDAAVPILAAIERTEAQNFKSALAITPAHTTSITVMIGPAGGWSDNEKTFLASKPFIRPVSLGPTILRAETAGIAMLGYIHLEGELK